jgi:hypothetical protein
MSHWSTAPAFSPVAGERDANPAALEHTLERVAHSFIVIDDENEVPCLGVERKAAVKVVSLPVQSAKK